MQRFGDYVRFVRKRSGLTSQELSRIVGVDRTYISIIENSHKRKRLKKVPKNWLIGPFAKKIGVSSVYITQIEKNYRLPSFTVVMKIVSALKDKKILDIYIKELLDKELKPFKKYATFKISIKPRSAHGTH